LEERWKNFLWLLNIKEYILFFLESLYIFEPINQKDLKKQFLYKEIELTENLNSKIITRSEG
jgi:hypothetical protein